MDPGSSSTEMSTRKRVSTACEACRAAKIKCQPSEQPGVCRKPLDGPCPVQSLPADGPSKTFTIDFDVQSPSDVDEDFDTLKSSHRDFIESIFPSEPSLIPLSCPPPMQTFPTPPPSSSPASLTMQSLHGKQPQFNLSSAESLLASFRDMLAHFPCIVLRPEDSVTSLAAERPFVLLAILAAASGSRTLQGHNLYDEEFRKVLGLKFVAAGDRSLELLQGILIYCTWYPYHLRPKNRQIYHHLRMAGDLIHDLELDQENAALVAAAAVSAVSSSQLDEIRGYLAYHYSYSVFVMSWRKFGQTAVPFTQWTSTCCDILEQNAQGEGDFVLASLVRLTNSASIAREAVTGKSTQSNEQIDLILLGLEAQHQERMRNMLPCVSQSTPVKVAEMYLRVYLKAGEILMLPHKKRPLEQHIHPISASRLCDSVPILRELFTYISSLKSSSISSFTTAEWMRLILSIIIVVRLSFGLPECPGWDDAWARSELRLPEFLAQMCDQGGNLTASHKRVDVLSAVRVVMQVVKEKYDGQVEALAAAAPMTTPGGMMCPMLDGSLDQYISTWSGCIDDPNAGALLPQEAQASGQQPVFHDLWATMTMGWAQR